MCLGTADTFFIIVKSGLNEPKRVFINKLGFIGEISLEGIQMLGVNLDNDVFRAHQALCTSSSSKSCVCYRHKFDNNRF